MRKMKETIECPAAESIRPPGAEEVNVRLIARITLTTPGLGHRSFLETVTIHRFAYPSTFSWRIFFASRFPETSYRVIIYYCHYLVPS